MWRGNAFGRIRLCICNALTFESHDLKVHFCNTGKTLEYLGQVRITRSSGQGQGHRSKKRLQAVCIRLKGNLVFITSSSIKLTFSYNNHV